MFRHHSLIFAAYLVSPTDNQDFVDITYMETYSKLSTYTNNMGSFMVVLHLRKKIKHTRFVSESQLYSENSTLGFIQCKVFKIINVENIRTKITQ